MSLEENIKSESEYVIEVTTMDGKIEVHRYPRLAYTDGLADSVKDMLESVADAFLDEKRAVSFMNPFVMYRAGTIVKLKLRIHPDDELIGPEIRSRAIGFLGSRDE